MTVSGRIIAGFDFSFVHKFNSHFPMSITSTQRNSYRVAEILSCWLTTKGKLDDPNGKLAMSFFQTQRFNARARTEPGVIDHVIACQLIFLSTQLHCCQQSSITVNSPFRKRWQ